MNKFVLFGDSYVDPLKVNAGECWSDLLARDAEVVNHGKSGTGPDYSLDLLENFIDKEFKGYEVVVFFIGFPCRFNFTGIPHPGHAVDVSNIHYWGSGPPLHGNLHFDRWHEENEDTSNSTTRTLRYKEIPNTILVISEIYRTSEMFV